MRWMVMALLVGASLARAEVNTELPTLPWFAAPAYYYTGRQARAVAGVGLPVTCEVDWYRDLTLGLFWAADTSAYADEEKPPYPFPTAVAGRSDEGRCLVVCDESWMAQHSCLVPACEAQLYSRGSSWRLPPFCDASCNCPVPIPSDVGP